MRHDRRITAVLLVLTLTPLALLLSGCGLDAPGTRAGTGGGTDTAASTASATDADPAPERGGRIPAGASAAQQRLAAGAGSRTPREALARYARLYINWTARTVARDQRRLAAMSLGQARAQALQAAVTYGADGTLRASGVTNRGSVIAVAPGQGADAGDWIVVTRETTAGRGDYAGLPASDHVTVAELRRTAQGWVVSGWQPES